MVFILYWDGVVMTQETNTVLPEDVRQKISEVARNARKGYETFITAVNESFPGGTFPDIGEYFADLQLLDAYARGSNIMVTADELQLPIKAAAEILTAFGLTPEDLKAAGYKAD